jgi:hypothetical protein
VGGGTIHPFVLSFSSIFFYMSNVFYDWPRRVHILPTKEPTFWSCPGSSFYTPSSKEKKEQKVNKIPSFSFSFSFTRRTIFFLFPRLLLLLDRVDSNQRDDEILLLFIKEREMLSVECAPVDDYYQETQCILGALYS